MAIFGYLYTYVHSITYGSAIVTAIKWWDGTDDFWDGTNNFEI